MTVVEEQPQIPTSTNNNDVVSSNLEERLLNIENMMRVILGSLQNLTAKLEEKQQPNTTETPSTPITRKLDVSSPEEEEEEEEVTPPTTTDEVIATRRPTSDKPSEEVVDTKTTVILFADSPVILRKDSGKTVPPLDLSIRNSSDEASPERSPTSNDQRFAQAQPRLTPRTIGMLSAGRTTITKADEPPKDNPALSKEEQARVRVLNEIIATERSYARDLSVIIEVFLRPLRDKPFISPGDLSNLFSNIEAVFYLSSEIVKEVDTISRCTPPESIPLGEVYAKFTDGFKIYSTYCNNQENQQKTYDRLQSHTEFCEFLKQCMRDPKCRKLELRDFLISPMQRLCKYPLLFKELLTKTDAKNKDYSNLASAKKKIEAVLSYVNERKRVGQEQQKVVDVQYSIIGCPSLVDNINRKFIREGIVGMVKKQKKKDKDKPRIKPKKLVLFNDIVILCSIDSQPGAEDKYIFKIKLPISTLRLVVVADTDSVKNAWELSSRDASKKQIILSASSPEELQVWMNDIKKIIKDFQKFEFSRSNSKLALLELQKKRFEALNAREANPLPGQNQDVWTLGILLYNLYTSKPVFDDLTPAQAAIAYMTREYPPKIVDNLPKEVIELLHDCWLESERMRPTFSMVYDRLRMIELDKQLRPSLASSSSSSLINAIKDEDEPKRSRKFSLSFGKALAEQN